MVERLNQLGGRAQVFEIDGFRHDAGPTVITAPFLFEELFQLFNENISDHLTFVPIDPWYRYYFDDGRIFDYGRDMDTLKGELAKFNPSDVSGYENLLAASKSIFDVGFSKLAHQPFTNFGKMIAQVPALLRLRADRTVSQLVNRHISDPMLRRAFSIQPLLVGGNPFSTTSIYSLIHYLERKWGVFFCLGGTGALVAALTDLMQRQGIKILTGMDVEQIELTDGKATSVTLGDGIKIPVDNVICNADPPMVYKELLKKRGLFNFRPKRPFPEVLTKYSMGLYVLYFGTDRKYPDVAHHTIWLGKRFKGLLKDIFDKGILSEDFSLYIHRPTATDETFAPPGCDSFYVLCPVPNLKSKINWLVESKSLRDRIVSALSKTILPDLENQITAEFWMDPTDFRNDYRARHGAGFSIAPIFRQSAWFRYRNRDPHIENLYFVGAGTHPGAGLPGVISSAKVVETLLKENLSKDSRK
ncbi:MAG: Phytoene desaturase (lycopene-forming) [Alphaproteobacteria bacterium MarineAlpha11_Bin1]|nr:MAG: Phytoene desaturase (lycopene-forming) [Alphaproteobacteria bacterium MarineAlpha11_Bin1]